MSSYPASMSATLQSRRAVVDLDRFGLRHRRVATLLEIDVTRARRSIRHSNRGGESAVSFLAWLVKSIAASVAAHSANPGDRSVRTGAVASDVSIVVDRLVDGAAVSMPLLVRRADSRSVSEIETEIRRARETPVDGPSLVLGRRSRPFTLLYTALPAPIRRALVARALRRRRAAGSPRNGVMVAPSGMGGRVKGWFIPRSSHPVCIGVGAVTPRAVVLNGTIVSRDVLHMTVLVDQGLADDARSAAWIASLVRSMETGREISVN